MSPLPDHLVKEKHWDWPWPFRCIPRKWTAFDWGSPKKVLGNQKSEKDGAPLPIGEKRSWQFSRYPNAPLGWKWAAWYVSLTLKNGRHFRIGARWDDVDGYVQWPAVASRVYTGEAVQDTSTK